MGRTPNLILPDPGRITDAMRRYAFSVLNEMRAAQGFTTPTKGFGSAPKTNQKLGKGTSLIYSLALAPSRLSGINVCRFSSAVCVNNCVAFNGNGMYPAIMRARIARTRFLFEWPEFSSILLADFVDRCETDSGVRLNTFSDIDWQTVAPWIFERRADLHFYDYTKDWSRSVSVDNYSLTYSASERTLDSAIKGAVKGGHNVAVVFSTAPSKALPTSWEGLTVIDGDKTDERWKDPRGVVVGLRAKGRIRTRGAGMVKHV